MSEYRLETLPYARDTAPLLRRFGALPGCVFLDSGLGEDSNGRFDILSALPTASVVRDSAAHSLSDSDDCFSAVQGLLDAHRPRQAPPQALRELPFLGGAIGYIGYDNSAQIGIYTWAIVVDHLTQSSILFALPACPEQTWARVQQCLAAALTTAPPFALDARFRSNFTRQEYAQAFATIQDYIHAGDCYQVNLAQRFSSSFTGAPLAAYLTLRQSIHSPFAGYMSTKHGAVLSFSPERFIRIRGADVLTQPIKGTRPRSSDPEQDEALAQALVASAKDRAENLMIVDLLRNDLGSLCAIGSVKVDKLFELHSFTNVHHLISSISARLEAPHRPLDLLRKCFPGGSITGAPKKRAMEIIAQLEPHSREVYCGTMLYVDFDGQADTNIMIRTLLCERNTISCWGGGGIVADSECALEYQECFDKINNIINKL